MDTHIFFCSTEKGHFWGYFVSLRGAMTPHISSFVAWSRSSSHMWGLRLLATHARSISLFWQMKEKKSFYSCSLFVIFIHSLAKNVCSRHPFVIEYGSQAQPCPWKLRPFGDQCQQFGDHCLCLKLWQFEIISVGMKARIRCHQSVPYPGPRIGQFQNRKQSHDNLTLLAIITVAGTANGFDNCW